MRRAPLASLVVGALAVVAGVAACGDNTVPANPNLLTFSSCYAGHFECATLVVPADWSEPESGATISLPVVRAPARDPATRIGVIMFNNGGPGEPTLDDIIAEYPSQPIHATVDLTQYFDFVAMDWRGVATTTPILTCLDTDTGARLSQQTFDPQTDGDWTAFFQLTSDIAAGCSANAANAPLLAHQDSESAARDLDALRVGLGEDTINMWVVSYGTRLGSMYATLFPDHVRAIALDSPMFPAPQLETFLTTQGATIENALQRFFRWCAQASATACPFQTADGSAASIAAKYEALLTAADTAPVVASGVTLDRPTINLAAGAMMYFPVYDWPSLGAALGALAAGSGAQLEKIYTSDAIDSATNDNSFSTYQNVCAQDMPLPAVIATQANYEQYADSLDAIDPHFGKQNAVAQAFALTWPAALPTVHPIGPTTAPPMLITATRNDPVTSYTWAGELQTAFDNGSYLVTYEGDGHANAGFQLCIGDVVADFLLDPTSAPSTTDCPEVPPTGIDGDVMMQRERPRFGRRR